MSAMHGNGGRLAFIKMMGSCVRTSKRALSVMLCMALVFSPVGGFAEADATPSEAVREETTVVLETEFTPAPTQTPEQESSAAIPEQTATPAPEQTSAPTEMPEQETEEDIVGLTIGYARLTLDAAVYTRRTLRTRLTTLCAHQVVYVGGIEERAACVYFDTQDGVQKGYIPVSALLNLTDAQTVLLQQEENKRADVRSFDGHPLCVLTCDLETSSETPQPETSMAPEATASPDPTAATDTTVIPETTSSPEVTLEPEASLEPGATATLAPAATLRPDATPEPQPTREPEGTPEPEETLKSEKLPDSAATPGEATPGEAALTGPIELVKTQELTIVIPDDQMEQVTDLNAMMRYLPATIAAQDAQGNAYDVPIAWTFVGDARDRIKFVRKRNMFYYFVPAISEGAAERYAISEQYAPFFIAMISLGGTFVEPIELVCLASEAPMVFVEIPEAEVAALGTVVDVKAYLPRTVEAMDAQGNSYKVQVEWTLLEEMESAADNAPDDGTAVANEAPFTPELGSMLFFKAAVSEEEFGSYTISEASADAFAAAVRLGPSRLMTMVALEPTEGLPAYFQNNKEAIMAYYTGSTTNSSAFNIKGYFKTSFIKTTYSDNGYQNYIQLGDDGNTKQQIPKGVTNGNVTRVTLGDAETPVDFKQEIRLDDGGRTVQVKYILSNPDSQNAITVKIGSCADTQIGDNDRATVTWIEGKRGSGLVMEDTSTSTKGARFNLSIENPTTVWFGGYTSRSENVFTSVDKDSVSDIDSGIAYSWTVELSAGGTVERTATFKIDSVLQIIAHQVNMTDTIDVTIDYEDKQGRIVTPKYKLDNGAYTSGTGKEVTDASGRDSQTFNIPIPDGWEADSLHTVTFMLTDDEGFESPSYDVRIVYKKVDGEDSENPHPARQRTLVFDGNGAASGSVGSLSGYEAETTTLPKNGFTRPGYTFKGWNTAADGTDALHSPNDSFKIPVLSSDAESEEVRLYAIWDAVQATPPRSVGISISVDELVYGYAENACTLTATASAAADHTLSYQWYEGDAPIAEATKMSYSVPVGKAVGSYRYHCVITATYTLNGMTATATTAVKPLMVTPAALTVTAQGYAGEYDGNAHGIAVSCTVSGARITYRVGDTADYTSNAPTFKDAGTYVVYYQVTCENYNPATGSETVQIDRKPVTVMPQSGQTKVYGEPDAVLTYAVADGISLSGQLARASGEAAGSYTILQGTVDDAHNPNYRVDFDSSVLFTVEPKPITIYPVAGQSKQYGFADPAVFPYQPLTAGALVSGDKLSGHLVRDRSAADSEAVGSYAFSWQDAQGQDVNYAITVDGGMRFTIERRKITVIPAAGQTKIYAEQDGTLAYTVGGNGLVGGERLSGALSREPGEETGAYYIRQGTLTSDNNPSYEIEFSVSDVTFDVLPRAVSVTPNAGQGKVYGGGDPALTYTLSEPLAQGNAVTGALSRAAGEDAGTYEITLGTLDAGKNYTLSITQGVLFTIAVKGVKVVPRNGQGKVYGEADGALLYDAEGLEAGDVLQGALSRAAGEEVGTYHITLGDLHHDNYIVEFTQGVPFTVSRRPVVVTPDAGQSKVYDGTETTPELRYTVSLNAGSPLTGPALVGSDALSGSLTRAKGRDVGDYGILQGTLTDGQNPNYALTFTSGVDFSIDPRPVIVTPRKGQSRPYDGTEDTPTLLYDVTLPTGSTLDGPALAGQDALSGKLSRAAGRDVGTYEILPGDVAHPNYIVTFITGVTFEITRRPVQITPVADQRKTYGETDGTLVYKTLGLVKDEKLTGALSREAGEDAGHYKILQGSVTDGNNPNYAVSFETGVTFLIGRKHVTVTPLDGQGKVYGEDDPTLIYQAEGLVGSDMLSGTLSRVPGENVGTYGILQGTLTDDENPNYRIEFSAAGRSLTISRKPITLTPEAGQHKTYGDPEPALTYTPDVPLVAGDALRGSLEREKGFLAGTYSITRGSITNTANPNYDITFVPGETFEIVPKPVTVTPKADQGKVYGDRDAGRLSYTVEPALINGDALAGELTREPGEDAGTYEIGPGTLRNPNYAITLTPNVTYTIAPKPVRVIPSDGQEKVYGDADPEKLSYTCTGLLADDTVSGDLRRVTGESAGTYAYTLEGLTASPNYTLTLNTGFFTIHRRNMNVIPDGGQGKIYLEDDPELTYKVEGMLPGDALSGSLGREPGEDAGVYRINQGSLQNQNYNIQIVLQKDVSFTIERRSIRKYGLMTKVIAQEFTGASIKPTFDVYDYKGPLLKQDTDYTVSYQNNKDLGEAVIRIQGTGNYNDLLEASFRIVAPLAWQDIQIGDGELRIAITPDSDLRIGNSVYTSIVTDRKNDYREFEAKIELELLPELSDSAEETEEGSLMPVRAVLDVSALPDVDETGEQAFTLRDLHLSQRMLGNLAEQRITHVSFTLDETQLMVPIASFAERNILEIKQRLSNVKNAARFRLRMQPVSRAELSTEERRILEDLNCASPIYYVEAYMFVNGVKTDVTSLLPDLSLHIQIGDDWTDEEKEAARILCIGAQTEQKKEDQISYLQPQFVEGQTQDSVYVYEPEDARLRWGYCEAPILQKGYYVLVR